jgi:hypothetical protein
MLERSRKTPAASVQKTSKKVAHETSRREMGWEEIGVASSYQLAKDTSTNS